ncbi:MAG TPA: MoaD/ThiS family protein [Chloroflexia bacterium]|nr:MoaD/ThiS family protein [Chloroflexia bacterium]
MSNHVTTATGVESPPAEMRIQARFFAIYREAAGSDSLAVQVPAGIAVRDLWQHLLAAQPSLQRASANTAYTAYAVNGTWAKPDTLLHDGDEVAFLPPVSGG